MTHNELVRDKMPEIIRANGKEPVTRALAGDEYKEALCRKLLDEVAEAVTSDDASKLADVMEVLLAMADWYGMTPAELESVRAHKADNFGTYAGKTFLEETKEA